MFNITPDYWNTRYQQGRTGWDIQGVSPAFAAWVASCSNPQDAILIPGCGNAHEAHYLLQKGFTNIHLLDFSSDLIEHLRTEFSDAIQSGFLVLHCRDFFLFQGTFDWIFEQTFFCALPPSRRADYVQHIHQLLSPQGKLVGLLFDRDFSGDEPPFGGNLREYTELFQTHFHIHHLAPTRLSIPPRLGSELWMELSKK